MDKFMEYGKENKNIEYIPATSSVTSDAVETNTILDIMKSNADLMNKAMNLASQMTEVYAESQRLAAKVECVKEYTKLELAKCAAKFQLAKGIIENTFSERRSTLQKFYDVLDMAIQKDDANMIISAMHEIGSVVVTSPLADIQNFIKSFEDTSQPLLDF